MTYTQSLKLALASAALAAAGLSAGCTDQPRTAMEKLESYQQDILLQKMRTSPSSSGRLSQSEQCTINLSSWREALDRQYQRDIRPGLTDQLNAAELAALDEDMNADLNDDLAVIRAACLTDRNVPQSAMDTPLTPRP